MRLCGILSSLVAILILFATCDIYKSKNDDWPNDVTLSITDLTVCPLDIFVDGNEKGRLESGESFSEGEFGQGVHLLEAFAWNDDKLACDYTYTGDLKKKESFHWDVFPEGSCGTCDPTPTPTPEATSTETPVPSPQPTVNRVDGRS